MDQKAKEQLMEFKKQLNQEAAIKKPKKKKGLSDRDLRELMGVNRPTYSRHNGAMRQR
ncbi:hypothetical protein [Jeotgalibacillus aurantiacus]|uniref:hypothetical protein n=1 Tax=Jeotgalibacillus aurantiacus TaxID=2763266 RepID=UPI001D09D369|nr:hypothetical protein [Jeotgalibacillus aurantiacus]